MEKKKNQKLKEILKPINDVIKQDKYDKHVYSKLINNQKGIKAEEAKLKKFYPPIKDLNRDVYASLYKFSPVFNEAELLKNSHKLNNVIVKSITEAKRYNELRENTKLDPVLSILGTSILQEEVKKIIEDKKDEIEKIQKEIEDATNAINQASKADNSGKGIDKNDSNSIGGGSSNKKLTLKEAKKKLEEALKKVDEFANKSLKRTKVNNIVAKVNSKINEVSDLITEWGLDQSSDYRFSGHEEKLALLDEIRNSRKLKEISKFLGRLKMLKFKEGTDKVKKGFEEISEIVLSDRIDKMLISEYNSLFDEDLQLLFLQKFADKKLLTYQLKSKTKNEVGSCVILIDSSGSMSGEKEIWAKGVAMAVLEMMKVQKRDLYIIHFSSMRNKKNLKVNNFEIKNHNNVREILQFVNYFEGNGTLFEPALSLARDKIDLNEKFSKADILFISDGQSVVSDSWLADFLNWKKEKHVNVLSILLNVGGYASTGSVKEFSDKIYLLSNIMSDNGVGTALNILSTL